MFREAAAQDLPRIAEIHSDAWREAYQQILDPKVLSAITPESRLVFWKQCFEQEDQKILLETERGHAVGFIRICAARPIENPPARYGELTHLYLDPNFVGKGHGHRLFELSKSMLATQGYTGMVLWTLEANSRARTFYEVHGMTQDDVRIDDPGWLGEGVFEVRYTLPFVGAQSETG